MQYWAESFSHSYGGAWTVGNDPVKALRSARSIVCETARTERGSFVIEFPDDAELQPADSMYGGWRSTNGVLPIRVVSRNKIDKKITDNQLLGREPE